MVLDETRTAGESGHLSDHNSLHDFYNAAVTAGVFDEATGTYKDTSPTEIYVPAVDLGLRSGAPTFDQSLHGGYGGWRMDAATTEDVARSFKLPNDWTTYDIVLYWSNVGAGTGDVVWRSVRSAVAGDGETMGASFTVIGATVAAPLQDVLKFTNLELGASAVDDKLVRIAVQRLGADAADTLANDSSVVGVLLRKAS